MSRALGLLALVVSGCAVEHPVLLDIDSVAPVSCVDSSSGTPLVARALAPSLQDEDVLLVFDFLRTPTFPRCQPTALLQSCLMEGCPAVPEARSCLRIPRSRIDAVTSDIADARLSDLVQGEPRLLDDAPDGTVVVRMTVVLDGAANTPCPAPDTPFTSLPSWDRTRLLGCGYSCPVVLGAESIVSIDLDPVGAGGRVCDESVVWACANLGLNGP